MSDCGFNEILDAEGLRLPKVEVKFGPFTYEQDEYRFWHRLRVGNVQLSVQADIFTPAVHVSVGENIVSVEGALYPPQWVHEAADYMKWFTSEFKNTFGDGYRKGQSVFGNNEGASS